MKKNIKFLVVAASLFICCISAVAIGSFSGQHKNRGELDAKKELQKIYDRLNSTAALNISGIIYLFDGNSPDKVKEETPFRYCKEKHGYYYQLGFLKTIVYGDVWLQLDTVNHFLSISSLDKQKKGNNASAFPLEALSSDTASFKTQLTATDHGSDRMLEIKTEMNPAIRTCRVFYQPENYQLKQSEIEWWNESAAQSGEDESSVWISKIKYQYHSDEIKIGEELQRIVEVKGNNFKVRAGYSDYHVTVL